MRAAAEQMRFAGSWAESPVIHQMSSSPLDEYPVISALAVRTGGSSVLGGRRRASA